MGINFNFLSHWLLPWFTKHYRHFSVSWLCCTVWSDKEPAHVCDWSNWGESNVFNTNYRFILIIPPLCTAPSRGYGYCMWLHGCFGAIFFCCRHRVKKFGATGSDNILHHDLWRLYFHHCLFGLYFCLFVSLLKNNRTDFYESWW